RRSECEELGLEPLPAEVEEFASALEVVPWLPLTQPREGNGHSGEQHRAGNRKNDLPRGHDRHPKEVLIAMSELRYDIVPGSWQFTPRRISPPALPSGIILCEPGNGKQLAWKIEFMLAA